MEELKGFIEVTLRKQKSFSEGGEWNEFKFGVNINNIDFFIDNKIKIRNKDYNIKESYKEIKELIKNAQ